MDRRVKHRLRQQVIIYKNIRTQDMGPSAFDKILYLVTRKMICQTYKKKPSDEKEEGKRARENTLHQTPFTPA